MFMRIVCRQTIKGYTVLLVCKTEQWNSQYDLGHSVEQTSFRLALNQSYFFTTGLEVIKLEYSLKLKVKHNDWLHADTCPQAANHCALLLV